MVPGVRLRELAEFARPIAKGEMMIIFIGRHLPAVKTHQPQHSGAS
jgi:hypothetical protein